MTFPSRQKLCSLTLRRGRQGARYLLIDPTTKEPIVAKPTPNPRPAVFLDRDGTICEEMGYLNHISRLQIFSFAADAIARLNRAGLPVIVVTNQSGVARRIFPEALIGQVQEKLDAELAAGGARIDAFYYCPHIKDQVCDCRKPLPGMM